MFADSIQGWDSYKPLYKEWIENAKSECKWVEVGVFLGKGLIGAAEYAKSIKKKINFYAIDTWAGSDEPEHKKFLEEIGGPTAFYNQFIKNVQDAGVADIIFPIMGKSVEISSIFEDNSLDMTFLDGSHKYEDVKADILAWKNKVRPDGWFAGHDVDCPPVIQAVEEIFGKTYDRKNDSWILRRNW